MKIALPSLTCGLLAACAWVQPAPGATDPNDMTELAKQTQDPTAEIVTFPIQFNYYTDFGPYARNQTVTNLQPVLPVSLNADWKLLTRYILPLIDTPVGENDRRFGLGDLTATFWLAPKRAAITWGAGPAFVLPTATDDVLGSGKWSVGPSFVAVYKGGPWVVGGLTNWVWSIAGHGSRQHVNSTTIQPFINYNLGEGAALSFSPNISIDWTADNDDITTLPLGLGYSKTVRTAGGQAMKYGGSVYYNALRSGYAARWQYQVSLTLLFPQ